MSDDSARAAKMRASICANLNRALGYQPCSGGPPNDGGNDGDHGPPGGGGDPPAGGPPNGLPVPAGADAGAHSPEVKPMGALPQLFYSDRTCVEDFIEEVKNFLCLNWDVPGYSSPIRKVAFTLSLLKGPEVASWAKSISDWIDGLDPMFENIPLVWLLFLQCFEDRFANTTRQEVAHQELDKLKLNQMNIDAHIAKFEELVGRAGFDLNTEENPYRFLCTFNQRPNILRRIMDPEAPAGYEATREKA
jgi:hypothetical protein